MSETEDVIQVQQATPVETTAALPTDGPIGADHTADDRTIDELLQEFDEKTRQPEPNATGEGAGESGAAVSSAELAKLLADLSGPSADQQKITALEGEIGSLRAAEFQAQERRAAEQWAGELQDVLVRSNPNLEDSFVMDRLKIMAAENPGVLEAAWQYRNLTDADLAQAQRDYRSAEALYQQALAQPDTEPRKQSALRYLEQRGAQLQAMLGSRQVIRNVRNEIRKRAESKLPDIDFEATADRDGIIQAIRDGGSGRGIPPEAPPNFGRMPDKEFKEYTRIHYGF